METFTTSDDLCLTYYIDDFICDAVPDRCAADLRDFLRRRFPRG